jgi:hypothetical protein
VGVLLRPARRRNAGPFSDVSGREGVGAPWRAAIHRRSRLCYLFALRARETRERERGKGGDESPHSRVGPLPSSEEAMF